MKGLELLRASQSSDDIDSSHLLLGVVFLSLALLLQFRPIDDLDIFWQVRLDQLMLEGGSLIDRDVFSFTHEGILVPTIGWLAQILFAIAYRVGEWRGVQLIHALLFSAAFLMAGITAVTLAGDGTRIRPFSLLMAMLFSLMAASSSAMVRLQSFGIFFFAVMLYLIRCGNGGVSAIANRCDRRALAEYPSIVGGGHNGCWCTSPGWGGGSDTRARPGADRLSAQGDGHHGPCPTRNPCGLGDLRDQWHQSACGSRLAASLRMDAALA